ncbi:MAG: DUF3857 domain-containing protein [Ignavibacteria bacterium]|jgi:hypothetical protein|nr:DUF3857 domain-containing protein [Ignavibacteria bacterium]
MNLLKSLTVLSLFIPCILFAQEDFTRALPDKALLEKLSKEKFPNSDAIIILKEQSFQETGGEFFYYGVDIPTRNTIFTKVLMVKLLNESAVKRYGSFEYEYLEPFGDEIKNGFAAKVRVMKPDGRVSVMPDDEVKIIVTSRDKNGEPLMRKAMFNVPDLAAGDFLQIEYQAMDVFSSSSAGLFFYNDEDITLISNVYITLPAKEEYEFKNYPAERIGQPKIQQIGQNYGDGETYFWSLRSLNAMPSEVFSLPFSDRSMMTCFYMNNKYIGDHNDWNSITERYFDKILDKGSVGSGEIELLGFKKNEENIDINRIDSLYKAMRKYFALNKKNYVYPRMDDLDKVFEEKKGDATDIAYIMYKILEKWDLKPKAVLIRDRRDGKYENDAPSMIWFDRIAVLVEINGKEKLYDFDRSLPSVPENPWYLNNLSMPVVSDLPCVHKLYSFTDKPENNAASEIHRLKLSGDAVLTDSLELSYTGSLAQRMRYKLYDYNKGRAEEFFKEKIAASVPKPEILLLNNYSDEGRILAKASGKSQFKSEVIDSFLTVNTGNIVLSEFRDKLFTSQRFNDIYFDSPYSFNVQYEIQVPEGYRLYSKLSDFNSTSPLGLNFSIKYNTDGGKIVINAREVISTVVHPAKNYNGIMAHLDNSLKELGKDIIFVKNNTSVASKK